MTTDQKVEQILDRAQKELEKLGIVYFAAAIDPADADGAVVSRLGLAGHEPDDIAQSDDHGQPITLADAITESAHQAFEDMRAIDFQALR
jgi:pyridoxal biosynthesis lyase PdxS